MNELEQAQVRELCRELIKIRSYSGEEQAIAAYLHRYLRCFDSVQIDAYGNLIARAKGSRPGNRLLFDGHLDTVPVPDAAAWRHPPFAAQLEGGCIYGRGATDMKGAVAAFCFAAVRFLKQHGRDFAGELCVAGTVHEERFEGVAAGAVSAAVQPDYVIIGEASEMNLKCSQRGRAEIVLETFGVPCHSSNPEKGVNAVYAMCRLIEAFRALPPSRDDRMAGDGILELTDVQSSPYPGASVVPESCRATFDRRLMVGETRESVLAPLRACIAAQQKTDPTLRARVSFSEGSECCYTGKSIAADRFFPAWCVPAQAPWVQHIYDAIRARGYTPELSGYSFCTNGSHYAGEAGIACLGIGPSRENLAHTIDEYIELKELYAVTDYYTAVMDTLL